MRTHEVLINRLTNIGWRLGFYPVSNWSWITSSRIIDVAWLYPIGALDRLGVFAAFEVALSDMTNRKQLVASVDDLEEIVAFLRVLVAPVHLAKDKNVAERYLDEIATRHPKISQIRENNLESILTMNWILARVQGATIPLYEDYMIKDGILYEIVSAKKVNHTIAAQNLFVPNYGFPTWVYLPDPFYMVLKELMNHGRKLGAHLDEKEKKIIIGETLKEPLVKGIHKQYRFLFLDEKSEVSKALLEWAQTGLAYARKGDNIIIVPL